MQNQSLLQKINIFKKRRKTLKIGSDMCDSMTSYFHMCRVVTLACVWKKSVMSLKSNEITYLIKRNYIIHDVQYNVDGSKVSFIIWKNIFFWINLLSFANYMIHIATQRLFTMPRRDQSQCLWEIFHKSPKRLDTISLSKISVKSNVN